MFDSMLTQLLTKFDPLDVECRSNAESQILLEQYEQWQKAFTFDALQDLRYGQSFCNNFNIQDNRIYYDRDWARCDQLIRREWIARH